MALDIDWKYIQKPLTVFSAVAIICLAILLLSHSYLNSYSHSYTEITQKISTQNTAIRQQIADNKTISKYQNIYWKLKRAGALNSEHRLKWINTFRNTSKSLKLRKARYQLRAQKEVTKKYGLNNSKVKLFSSTMQIDIEMLHEGDLLRLFTALRKTPGLLNVSSCAIGTREGNIKLDTSSSNVFTVCNIDWYTFIVESKVTNNKEANNDRQVSTR